jgi:hypothetical protein
MQIFILQRIYELQEKDSPKKSVTINQFLESFMGYFLQAVNILSQI